MRVVRNNQSMTDPNPFATALNAALEQKRITLTRLRDELARRGHPLPLGALSYWRSGMRLPERRSSLDAIPELESLLGLEPGALARLLPSPATRRIGQVERFDSLIDYPVQTSSADAALVSENEISRISTQVVLVVGASRRVLSTTTRRLIVAERDGVESMTTFRGTNILNDDGSYRFRAIAGCSIGEVRRSAENVHSVQLVFPQPLMRGESVLTEVEVSGDDVADDPIDDYKLAAEQRLEEATVWVRFDESAIPSRCWVYFHEAGLRHEWPVDIAGTGSVHYRLRDFGPGGLGVRWEW